MSTPDTATRGTQTVSLADEEKVKDWLDKGAQPSQTVARLLKVKNIG